MNHLSYQEIQVHSEIQILCKVGIDIMSHILVSCCPNLQNQVKIK